MTTIEIDTRDRTNVAGADRMPLIAVCVMALLGLAGIISMTA
ncbi:hypothetical protein [Planosporangium mesophilum]|uniref:Uncharacterized protein n=1 Tax=Planosporangium mesophilum TaxID=689768 RepID=A0A8J3T6P4_9ACTN|nr:hypothetical protein [Planosporangium mesophilum]GII21535.1 hypothetical protein Pme01_11320 [Planosporangium mesophilum]